MKGYVYSNGAQYEIYETTKVDQPSIEGIATFKQYWSVCTEKRSKGTIDLYDHFRAWESNGMKLGKIFEIGMIVEACQSSGSAELSMDISNIGKYIYTPTPYSTPTPVIEKNGL